MQTQFATPAADGGVVRLRYHAAEVRMVVAGEGDVGVLDENGEERTIHVDGTPRSYRLQAEDAVSAGILTLDVPAGVQVYSLTFG